MQLRILQRTVSLSQSMFVTFLILETVPGIVMLSPDNSTSIQSFVQNYSKASMGSNHWVGSTRYVLIVPLVNLVYSLTNINRIGTNSSTAVVDANCKVFNTDNLFILDAGVIPSQPMSNIHATIMTVAEMGVVRILALSGGP